VVFGVVAGVGAGPNDPSRIGLVALLAVLAGVIQIALALFRLGRLARLVPESVILGFMAGASLLVVLSQVPTVLGLQASGASGDHILFRLWLTWTQGGPVSGWSLAISLSAVVLVVGVHGLRRRLGVRLPEMLLSLVVVSALVGVLGLSPDGGQTGRLHVEGGFPTPRLLALPPDWAQGVPWIGGGALAVALVGLVEALVMARSLASWSGAPLDYDRQCLAEGLANLGGGLFGCLPGSGSPSRSAVNYYSGAATRLSGVFSAFAVAASLWLFAPLAGFVPLPALAGVLLWSAWRIIDPPRMWACLRATRVDAILVLSTAFAVVCIRIDLAVLVGSSLSLVCRSLRNPRGGGAISNGSGPSDSPDHKGSMVQPASVADSLRGQPTPL
jgi:SulP family sulfate permease